MLSPTLHQCPGPVQTERVGYTSWCSLAQVGSGTHAPVTCLRKFVAEWEIEPILLVNALTTEPSFPPQWSVLWVV